MQYHSPEEATIKFHQMGVLLLLDSPSKLQFGIDNISWQIGDKFKGIKLIPLGTHIITYSLKDENYMFPIKKFLHFGPTSKLVGDDERIRVFRWSKKREIFEQLKGQQAEGYREGVKKYHFDCYLGAYPQQNIEFWASNTKYITKQVLEKLDPVETFNKHTQEYQEIKQNNNQNDEGNFDGDDESQQDRQLNIHDDSQNIMEAEEDQKQVSDDQNKDKNQPQNAKQIKKNKDFGGNIFYSEIPRKLTQSSQQTTFINLDKTLILQTILKYEWPRNELAILGQLQYSFVAFLVGQCLDSYNQWKKLLITLSSSEKAFDTHQNLMLQFIAVLFEQLKQFPEDFFYDTISKDNFLASCLQALSQYYRERSINKKAINRIEKLLVLVSTKFNYQPEQKEEESPIIVEQNQSYF